MGDHLRRAQILFDQERYELAQREVGRVLAEDPIHGFAHSILALCIAEIDGPQHAIEPACQGIALAPENAYAHQALANIYLQLEQFDEAENTIRDAIRLQPDDADLLGFLGLVQVSRKQLRDAEQTACQGLAIDPQNATCLNVRGVALLQGGNAAEAQLCFEQILELDPQDSRAHFHLGVAKALQGESSKGHAAEALRIDPDLFGAVPGVLHEIKSTSWFYRCVFTLLGSLHHLRNRILLGIFCGHHLSRVTLLTMCVVFAFWLIVQYEFVFRTPQPARRTQLLFLGCLGVTVLTNFARPLLHTAIALHPLARETIPKKQFARSVVSSIVGILSLVCLACWVAYRIGALGFAALALLLLSHPAATIFEMRPDRWRRRLFAMTLFLVAVACAITRWLYLEYELRSADGLGYDRDVDWRGVVSFFCLASFGLRFFAAHARRWSNTRQ